MTLSNPVIHLSRVLFLIALLGVTTLAVLPGSALPAINLWDKLNHALAFFVLALLLAAACPGLALLRQWLILLSYGVAIELLQAGLSYRDASLADVLANVVGIALAALILVFFRRLSGDGD